MGTASSEQTAASVSVQTSGKRLHTPSPSGWNAGRL
jgi:hypothetical protein